MGRDPEKSVAEARSMRGAGLDALARRYALPLRRFFERRVKDQNDVPDLVQDVLMRMARMNDLSSVDKPEHYLFRTASSALKDQARRDFARRRNDHVEFDLNQHDSSGFSPDRVLQARLALAAVHEALRSLPERTRDIVVLKVFEEKKTSEIACLMGISTRAVEAHCAKGLAILAAAVKAHRDD